MREVGFHTEGLVTVDLSSVTQVASNVATSIAVVIGGIWAYFKFIRGRTFAHRAELDVSSSLEESSGSLYLIATVTLKNTGLSKLPLNSNLKAIRLSGMANGVPDNAYIPEWERIVTVPVLDQHQWLEAQETVIDKMVYCLSRNQEKNCGQIAYQVEVIVGAPRRLLTGKGTRWEARDIVFAPSGATTNEDLAGGGSGDATAVRGER
jgi:hypothetical protein